MCLQETEKLEAEKSAIESEIHNLQQEKDQLEFLLQAHEPVCKVDPRTLTFKVKTEPHDNIMTSSMTSSCSSTNHLPSYASSTRPSSLQLAAITTVAGVPLTTPTSGLFSYSALDGLESTGLTPLVSGPTMSSSTGLTPLVAGPTMASSCASQVQRSEEASVTSNGESNTSPSLVSL